MCKGEAEQLDENQPCVVATLLDLLLKFNSLIHKNSE